MWLGHQADAFALVLASLLVSSAVGAALSMRLERGRSIAFVIAGFILMLLGYARGLEPLVELGWQLPTTLKLVLGGLASAALGALMGMPFPRGLVWLEQVGPRAVPWAVGLNFLASVIATLCIVPLAMSAGYGALLGAGAGAYAVVAAVAWSAE
jgi:hypothetical protein